MTNIRTYTYINVFFDSYTYYYVCCDVMLTVLNWNLNCERYWIYFSGHKTQHLSNKNWTFVEHKKIEFFIYVPIWLDVICLPWFQTINYCLLRSDWHPPTTILHIKGTSCTSTILLNIICVRDIFITHVPVSYGILWLTWCYDRIKRTTKTVFADSVFQLSLIIFSRKRLSTFYRRTRMLASAIGDLSGAGNARRCIMINKHARALMTERIKIILRVSRCTRGDFLSTLISFSILCNTYKWFFQEKSKWIWELNIYEKNLFFYLHFLSFFLIVTTIYNLILWKKIIFWTFYYLNFYHETNSLRDNRYITLGARVE